jgi:ribose/xylose/arabinose/galactoside ABC-type transport system permease subunit
MLTGGVGLPIGTLFGVLFNALIERIVPMLGIVDASWPRVITSAFLFTFIVLQSVLVSTSKKGGFKLLLPEWMRFKSKKNDLTSKDLTS